MYWLILLLIVSVPVVAECNHDPGCDARSQLAMNYMHERFGNQDSDLDVWLNNWYGPDGKQHLEMRRARLQKLAAWAMTLKPQDKNAYLGVIDWYQDGITDALTEWNTHAIQKRQQAYERHLRECAEKARKLEADKANALPQLPQ